MTDSLQDWVFSLYGQESFQPGLERIGCALHSLKPQLQKSRVVIIAGTNGKGETTHRLSRLLRSSSFCSWTSPHIQSMAERFSSEEGDIDLSQLKILLEETHLIVQQEKFQLTYYEFLFFAFCRWVIQRKPAFLLLEVGLGGRMDAVNVLDAQLVLLTSISRDHQEFLGNRYDLILSEKLGVLRSGQTLISFLELKYLRESAESLSRRLGVKMLDLEEVTPLPAYEFSRRNQLLAAAAFCHLTGKNFDPGEWPSSEEKLSFRGEVIKARHEWWLFGSHNPDGMRKLIQFLHSANYNFKDSPFDVVLTSFSKRNEKDIRVMLKMLKQARLGKVVVTSFNHPKACPPKAMEMLARQEGLDFVEDISDHVHGWTHQKILVAGSYYLLGELQPLFGSR